MKKGIACILALMILIFCTSCVPVGDSSANKSDIRSIVLVIGDGMGYEHITAGKLMSGKEYTFTHWQNVNVNTDSLALDEDVLPRQTQQLPLRRWQQER